MNNKMNKVEDIAYLQANNRSLLQELQTMTLRHRNALQQNQELKSQNEYLFQSIKNHLEDDWTQHRSQKDHTNFNGHHVDTLEKIRQQLSQSLNALQKPPNIFQTLKQYDSQQSLTPKNSASLQEDYDHILNLYKQIDSKPAALWQDLKDRLQQYHRKVLEMAEELNFQRNKMERYETHRLSLEDALNDAKEANKNIYHQLLSVSQQLQNAQRVKHQVSITQEQRQQLQKIIQKYQQENKLLKQHIQARPVIQRESSQQHELQQLRKCYKEIAALKSRIQLSEKVQRDNQVEFQSDRAELELAHLVTRKQLEEREKLVKELKKELQAGTKSQIGQNRDKEVEQYKQEIYLLKIKVFALESLEIGNKYKVSRDLYFQDFIQKMKPYLQFCDDWKLEALQLMAENHSIIKELERKLEEEETQTDRIRKKYNDYKEKYNSLVKSRHQSENQIMEGYKAKNKEYQTLIERMQVQMEKFETMPNDNEVNEMAQRLVVPLQQQIDVISFQNASLKNELIIKEQLMADQSYQHQTRIQTLKDEIEKLKHDNSSLQRANRQSQSMLLEHNLNLKVSRIQGNSTKSQGKRSHIQSQEQSQIKMLEQQITLLRSRLQQQYDLLSKETVKNQKLNSLNKSQGKQLQDLKNQIKQARNKQKESIISNQSPLIFSQTQVPRINSIKSDKKDEEDETTNLKNTITELKIQLMKERQFSSELTERAQRSVQGAISYQKRIQELEVILNKVNKEKERALQEVDYLIKQNQNQQEKIDMMKGNSSSLKQIQLIQQNSEFETQISVVKNKLFKKNEELEKVRQELQNLTKENDFFCQEVVKLKNIIKEFNIEHNGNTVNFQDMQKEMGSRVEQLYKKIKALNEDKEVLNNLVQELRNKSLSAHSINSYQGSSDTLDKTYLKSSLLKAQKEVKNYKQQLEKIKEEREGQLQKLTTELQAVTRQLQFYKKSGIKPFVGKRSISSRGVSEKEHSDIADQFYHDGTIVKSEVIDPVKQIELKNIIIRQLKEELQQLKHDSFTRYHHRRKTSSEHEDNLEPTYGEVNKFRSFELLKVPQTISKKVETRSVAVGPDFQEEDRSDIYLKQVYELRNETQKLRQSNLVNQKKIRTLQEQNSSLRFKLLSGTSHHNYPPELKGINKPSEYKPVLPAPIPLKPYFVNSSNHSNPGSSLSNEDKLSSGSGIKSNSSMPAEYQGKPTYPKSKFFFHEDKVIQYESQRDPSQYRNFKKTEKQDIDALAPLVQSIQGLDNA